jgi:hypothetical protein
VQVAFLNFEVKIAIILNCLELQDNSIDSQLLKKLNLSFILRDGSQLP